MTQGKNEKPHKPTEETRKSVNTMSACGITQEDISKIIGIDVKTLRKHYREELDTATAKANTTIAQSLFNKAKNGDTSSQIFWLKTRGGWKTTVVNEVFDKTPKVVKDNIPNDSKSN